MTINIEIDKFKSDKEYISEVCSNIDKLNNEKAESLFKKIIDISKEHKLKFAEILAKYYFSSVEYSRGNYNKAIEYLEEAYRYFDSKDDAERIIGVINSLIVNYCFCMNFEEAISYGIKGLEKIKYSNNYSMMGKLLNNMAGAYVEIGDFKNAKELYTQIMKLPRVEGKDNEATYLSNIAECERELGNLDRSLEILQEALSISENYNEIYLPYVYGEIANTLSSQGKMLYAESMYSKAIDYSDYINSKYSGDIDIRKRINNKLIQVIIRFNWAEFDMKLKKFKRAKCKFMEIEEILKSFQQKKLLIKTYKNISICCKELKEFENAYNYLEKYNESKKELESSIQNLKNSVHNKKLLNEKENIYKKLFERTSSLYTIGQKLVSKLSSQNIYDSFVKELKRIIKYDSIEIALVNGQLLKYEFCEVDGKKVYKEDHKITENTLESYVVNYCQDIYINDIENEYKNYIDEYDESLEYNIYKSVIMIPIIISNKIKGIVSIKSNIENTYRIENITSLKILTSYVGIALENARLYKEVEYNANHDTLTGLYNRRKSLVEGQKIFNEIMLKNQDGFVIIIDIDNFKLVNDTYGHLSGDEVLKSVSNQLFKLCEDKDIFGRYGGEEFIIFSKRSKEECYHTAEVIRKSIKDTTITSIDGQDINVTVSIGISKLEPKELSFNQCIDYSDKALYNSKTQGKDRISFYSI